jgi:hypothetical protein
MPATKLGYVYQSQWPLLALLRGPANALTVRSPVSSATTWREMLRGAARPTCCRWSITCTERAAGPCPQGDQPMWTFPRRRAGDHERGITRFEPRSDS